MPTVNVQSYLRRLFASTIQKRPTHLHHNITLPFNSWTSSYIHDLANHTSPQAIVSDFSNVVSGAHPRLTRKCDGNVPKVKPSIQGQAHQSAFHKFTLPVEGRRGYSTKTRMSFEIGLRRRVKTVLLDRSGH